MAAVIAIGFVELGYAAYPAVIIIVALFPVQIYLGRLKARTGMEYTKITSRRVHIMSEILTAIKLIKFYAWEMPFYNRIVEIRKREMKLLRTNIIANVCNFMLVICIPIFITYFCLLVYWRAGHRINPIIGYTAASVFNIIRYPLFMTPVALNSISGINFLIIFLTYFI